MNAAYRIINEEYKTWLDTLGFSDSVVYDYPHRTRDFFTWLQTKNIEAITDLKQSHLKAYYHYFLAIDKLLEFLHNHGMHNAPIPTNHRIKQDERQRINNIEVLTQAEIKALYNNIENTYQNQSFTDQETKRYQLKLIFALYYACGLRRSEGHQLTLDDIDFDKGTVFVQKGKNYKDRIIPMSEGVYRDLQDYIYNFRNRLNVPHKRLFIYTTGTLNNSLQHLQSVSENEAIQAKRLTLHVLRHSIATHLL